MTINELIEKHEGRRLKPYKCTAGHCTIGVGWNMDANPLPKAIRDYFNAHGSITQEMSDELLNISIERAEADCMRLFPDWDKFSPNRKMALTDFVFQLGLGGARKFVHAIAAINTSRWEDAAKEMMDSSYAKQCRNRAKEVTEMIEVG